MILLGVSSTGPTRASVASSRACSSSASAAGMFYPSITTAAVTALDAARASLAGGIVYMFQIAGGAVGLGLSTTIFTTASEHELERRRRRRDRRQPHRPPAGGPPRRPRRDRRSAAAALAAAPDGRRWTRSSGSSRDSFATASRPASASSPRSRSSASSSPSASSARTPDPDADGGPVPTNRVAAMNRRPSSGTSCWPAACIWAAGDRLAPLARRRGRHRRLRRRARRCSRTPSGRAAASRARLARRRPHLRRRPRGPRRDPPPDGHRAAREARSRPRAAQVDRARAEAAPRGARP